MSVSLSLNKVLKSVRSQQKIGIASCAMGLGLTTTSLRQLFDHEVGTNTQIMTIAIPLIVIVGRWISTTCGTLQQRQYTRQHPLVVPFVIGALFVMAIHSEKMQLKDSRCDYYDACPNAQPHFVQECKRLMNECRQGLVEAEWHLGDRFTGYSYGRDIYYAGGWDDGASRKLIDWCAEGSSKEFRFETKVEAVQKLSSHIIEKDNLFKRVNDNDSICFRVHPKDLEKVNTLRAKLYNISKCHPDIENNYHYQVISRLNVCAIYTLIALAGLFLTLQQHTIPKK